MSRALHRLFLDRLIPRNWSDHQPPILLNSWEAKYFDVNHANITEMARQVRMIDILSYQLYREGIHHYDQHMTMTMINNTMSMTDDNYEYDNIILLCIVFTGIYCWS